MWGCSVGFRTAEKLLTVFPTHVGMFRFLRFLASLVRRFPHACGDVPNHRPAENKMLTFTGKVFPTHVGMFRE